MTSLQDMDALSLFDGMGCGWIALRELGITPRRCYASEIDKHAIAQVKLNFPEVEHLGDVTRWREWPIDWSRIGLLLAGSPCQGFSMAGKQLAFDDPRSALFFVFVDILNHIRKFNPDVKFLLENVNMKREHMRVINEYVGLFPVNINSSLVSAQNRDRWYWSNVRTRRDGLFGEVHTDIPQPADRGILLRDILDNNVPEKYYLSDKQMKYILEPTRLSKGFTAINGDKSLTLTAKGISNWTGTVIQLNPAQEFGTQPRQQNRFYSTEGKSPSLNTCMGGNLETKIWTQSRIRRLTPTECARLQTIPEWYKWGCSETQQYKMLGNGWSIEVITHILQYLER